jgi:glutathione S-transferase
MLKIHHLSHSQSERILWLCEELGLPYTVERHERDPVTRLSPPSLKALHPLGAAPLVEVEGQLLAESAAIVDFTLARFGGGRLRHGPAHPDFSAYLYWFHFANGNLQPAMFRAMTAARCAPSPEHPLRAAVDERLQRVLQLVDARLSESDYLAGSDFTAADIMSVFSLTTMRRFHPLDLSRYQGILGYLQRVGARPAYRAAMAKADPGSSPLLT